MKATDREGVLRELCDAASGHVGVEVDDLMGAVREREALASTGFGQGLAMPHVRLPAVRQLEIVLGRVRSGVEFAAHDARPVHLFCLIVGSEADRSGYQKVMGRAARFLKAEGPRLLEADDLCDAVLTASEGY